MSKPRDYKAEYARRIEKGQSLGLSRSQARGHARTSKGELPLRQITKFVTPPLKHITLKRRPVLSKGRLIYESNVNSYANLTGMSPAQVRKDIHFQSLHRAFNQALKAKDRDIDLLTALAKEIGRKEIDDPTPFGETPKT